MYLGKRITGQGFFSHEILVDLGDVPIEHVTLESPGVDVLNSFTPGTEFEAANKQFRDIATGIRSGPWNLSRSIMPQSDRTYAIRVVAFDNKDNIQKRLIQRRGRPDLTLWMFQGIQSDKRIDVIVTFRVIRVEEDGNITILWKQLTRKKSPVITFGANKTLKGFG